MELSLSIESFPLSAETAGDMLRLLDGLETDYRTVTGAAVWRSDDARGFAVLAYTDKGELKGFATAIDIVNMHHYEWSAVVAPDLRRLGIGKALAEGIHHGLEQRGAEGALAACIEEDGTDEFLDSLGYVSEFKEMQLRAKPRPDFSLPAGVIVAPAEGEDGADEAAHVLAAAFDDDILPVLAHNIADSARLVWLMKAEERTVASATTFTEDDCLWITALGTHPEARGNGYGEAFLHWSRKLAADLGLSGVMLDVETDNDAIRLYERAGFLPVETVAYWRRQ
ncbi:GNAT family N-acetyltransferase [Indiicoccus explosivorum]|uniref:GNAT family N-acetyltransferase n=1 Tax=Indiicoccus explosivorum TaxID=1917864 RepID=UPI00138FA164|nr:GNAT family N-acetyltransferase [Indiicoccus explosivorum]